VGWRLFSPRVSPAEEPLSEVNPVLHLRDLMPEPKKLILQRIQPLLARRIPGVARNASGNGLAEP